MAAILSQPQYVKTNNPLTLVDIQTYDMLQSNLYFQFPVGCFCCPTDQKSVLI